MASTQPKPNFLERAIASVSPKYALERAVAKDRLRLFGYDAANPGTLRSFSGGPSKNGSPETARMNRDRELLMWDARDLERNHAIIFGILDRIPQYVCHRLEYRANTGNKTLNRAYEDYFHNWCESADVSGRHRFRTLVELALRSTLRDGDVGMIIVRDNGHVRLQPIEADRIGNSQDGQNTEFRVGGVVLDQNQSGRPVGYRIYKRTPTNQYTFESEVPADNFIHIFRPTRLDQYRGISALAPVLDHARDSRELMGFEKQAAKWQASFGGFIKTQNPRDNSVDVQWDTPASAATQTPASMEVVASKIQRLGPNEDVVFADPPTRPSGAFLAFHETLIRLIAMGINMPYGFVYNMADLGGATARIDVKQAERGIQRWQTLLEDTILNRVKNLVIAVGISRGELPATAKWRNGEWSYGAYITADVGYQTQADVQLVQLGLKSARRFASENGLDRSNTIEDIYDDIAEQRDRSAGTHIPMELFPGANPQASMLLAAMNESRRPTADLIAQQQMGQPQPPPGLIGTIGDKGVKTLIDICEKVSTGMMDRDSAVMQVIAAYGMSPQEAELIIPKKALPQPKPAAESAPKKKK